MIDGKPVESVNGRFIPVENPSKKEQVIAEVPNANAEDVNIAVATAERPLKAEEGHQRGSEATFF